MVGLVACINPEYYLTQAVQGSSDRPTSNASRKNSLQQANSLLGKRGSGRASVSKSMSSYQRGAYLTSNYYNDRENQPSGSRVAIHENVKIHDRSKRAKSSSRYNPRVRPDTIRIVTYNDCSLDLVHKFKYQNQTQQLNQVEARQDEQIMYLTRQYNQQQKAKKKIQQMHVHAPAVQIINPSHSKQTLIGSHHSTESKKHFNFKKEITRVASPHNLHPSDRAAAEMFSSSCNSHSLQVLKPQLKDQTDYEMVVIDEDMTQSKQFKLMSLQSFIPVSSSKGVKTSVNEQVELTMQVGSGHRADNDDIIKSQRELLKLTNLELEKEKMRRSQPKPVPEAKKASTQKDMREMCKKLNKFKKQFDEHSKDLVRKKSSPEKGSQENQIEQFLTEYQRNQIGLQTRMEEIKAKLSEAVVSMFRSFNKSKSKIQTLMQEQQSQSVKTKSQAISLSMSQKKLENDEELLLSCTNANNFQIEDDQKLNQISFMQRNKSQAMPRSNTFDKEAKPLGTILNIPQIKCESRQESAMNIQLDGRVKVFTQSSDHSRKVSQTEGPAKRYNSVIGQTHSAALAFSKSKKQQMIERRSSMKQHSTRTFDNTISNAGDGTCKLRGGRYNQSSLEQKIQKFNANAKNKQPATFGLKSPKFCILTSAKSVVTTKVKKNDKKSKHNQSQFFSPLSVKTFQFEKEPRKVPSSNNLGQMKRNISSLLAADNRLSKRKPSRQESQKNESMINDVLTCKGISNQQRHPSSAAISKNDQVKSTTKLILNKTFAKEPVRPDKTAFQAKAQGKGVQYDSVEEMLLSNPKMLFQKRKRLIALQEL